MKGIRTHIDGLVANKGFDDAVEKARKLEEAVERYAEAKVIEELEIIEDIINSENSGLSAEQRLLEVLNAVKELKQ